MTSDKQTGRGSRLERFTTQFNIVEPEIRFLPPFSVFDYFLEFILLSTIEGKKKRHIFDDVKH